jgi:hypothetical protein
LILLPPCDLGHIDTRHDTLGFLKVLADLQASGANVLRGLDPTTLGTLRRPLETGHWSPATTTPATTLSVS